VRERETKRNVQEEEEARTFTLDNQRIQQEKIPSEGNNLHFMAFCLPTFTPISLRLVNYASTLILVRDRGERGLLFVHKTCVCVIPIYKTVESRLENVAFLNSLSSHNKKPR
jgi:hypothetical protein